ncbi:MAG: hypothetical protein R2751_19250 [Bacteroidales bacterium]
MGGIAYVWTGGADQAEEGTWLWDGNNDGDGDHFWTGEGSYGIGGGSAEEGAYVNWGGSSAGTVQEPDNFGATGQNALALGLAGWPAGTTALGIAGEWNDLALNSAIYYIIEYTTASAPGTEPRTTDGIDPIRIYPNPQHRHRSGAIERIPGRGLARPAGQTAGGIDQPPHESVQTSPGVYILPGRCRRTNRAYQADVVETGRTPLAAHIARTRNPVPQSGETPGRNASRSASRPCTGTWLPSGNQGAHCL